MIVARLAEDQARDSGAWSAALALAFACCVAGLAVCWRARGRARDDNRRFVATVLAALFALGLVVVLVAAGISFVAMQAED